MSIRVLLLSAGAALLVQPLAAQDRHCGFDEARQSFLQSKAGGEVAWRAARQELVEAVRASEHTGAFRTTASGAIPVVFHVVLTAAQLSQIGGPSGVAARVDSSLAVINRDYNAQNSDVNIIPPVFQGVLGNAGIRFGKAIVDPSGASTPGYEIYTTSSSGFTVDRQSAGPGSQYFCAGAKYTPAEGGSGLRAWDPAKYLNVWVTNITSGGSGVILGVAVPPSLIPQNVPAREIGVTLNYGAFGKFTPGSNSNYFVSGIDGGRTLTHELGHFFELLHVFGDGSGCPPPLGSDSDDDISDTPPQDASSSGCPSSPPANSCSAMGKMYVNYMDYSNDACLVMFTKEQSALMQKQVAPGGSSYGITQNPGLLSTGAVAQAEVQMNVTPNPASDALQVRWPLATPSQQLTLSDATGRVVERVVPGAGQSAYQFDLSHLPRGLYLVRATFATGTSVRKVVLQ